MFNDYSFSSENNVKVNSSFSINAVSGTLSKRHPKSRFVIVGIDEANKIFDPSNPSIMWGEEEKEKTEYETDYSRPRGQFGFPQREVKRTVKVAKMESVVVLQSMILPNNKLLCEVVLEKDFYSQ